MTSPKLTIRPFPPIDLGFGRCRRALPSSVMKSRRFTARSLPCFRPKSIRHQAAGRDVLLGGVLCRGLLDHGRNNGIVGRDPIRRNIPFFAIPGLDAARPRAFVISARDLDRLQLVLEAELLEPLRSQVFTRVTARRIAQLPKATFVTRLQPLRLPARAARQLPDQSTTLRVDSSSTSDARLRGALPTRDIGSSTRSPRRRGRAA
jgi:hypothetical protein